MSKVLIIDGGAKWHGTGGTLTHSFVELATDVLNSFGHQVTVTTVDREFSVDEEVEKIIDADSIILQFPAWWMNPHGRSSVTRTKCFWIRASMEVTDELAQIPRNYTDVEACASARLIC